MPPRARQVLATLGLTLALLPVGRALATGGQNPATQATQTAGSPDIPDVQEIARGVYAIVPAKPPGFLADANSVFIINDDDVVVVDTNLTPASAEASLRALRRLTSKPVRTVINTHWHVDHVSGNQVYRRAFPGVEIIAQARARADLVEKGAKNRADMREQARQFVTLIEGLLSKGTSLSGTPLTPVERSAYEADVALTRQLVEAIPSIEIVAPTMAVEDRLTLFRGSREIQVLQLGRSHTHGDLVVFLPQDGVVITGDLVTSPTPLIGGDQSFVGDWVRSLDHLLTLPAKVYIPGHGPVLRDREPVEVLRGFLDAVDRQAASAQAKGESLEQASESITLDDYRRKMAGDDPVLRTLFRSYGRQAALAAAFRDGARPVQPLPSVTLPPELDRVLRDYEKAWQARDAGGLAALFTADGFVLSSGRPAARGREAITRHYAGAGGALALRALSYATDGTKGYIIGAYGREPGGRDVGKFVLALSRDARGRWLIAADIDNGV